MRQKRPVVIVAIAVFLTLNLVLYFKPTHSFAAPEYAEPLPPVTTGSHPIHILHTNATAQFEALRQRQSQSLPEAVAEYRRRYQLPPPPYFDKWYAFAKKRNVRLIDEYDTIFHSVQPFWAVPPGTLRERVRESVGYDNGMIALMIRNGAVAKIEGGGDGAEWHREATEKMISSFVQYLPDMDVAFNVHDEPRVVMQHDALARHVEIAKTTTIPAALGAKSLKNGWSKRPDDLGTGMRIKEYRTTRFNAFAHQPTWTNARMSCPLDSPARSIEDGTADDAGAYAVQPMGFISNTTAFSDICNTPSLERTYGFFDRPNAFKVTHELFPVFSQSKVSSFQDILYPSPWYWVERVPYKPRLDVEWEHKHPSLYWRGSTTGGFSRDGGWRRQHRQLFIQKINKLDSAKVLERTSSEPEQWTEKEVPRQTMNDLFDVKFTYIGQCDPGDCDAQKEYFEVVPPIDQYNAYQWKYLLDIDGNAFSGRYYSFLLCKSLVYKLAIFREWHDEWLKAWVHYIPLGLKGDEYVETLRYLDRDETGQVEAKQIADYGRSWASNVLRKEDMEAWYFRLLLEYGRVMDNNREKIGYME